ncbi:MAG: hypothetical protein ACPGOY_08815 [Rhodospirillaceae bacterium]
MREAYAKPTRIVLILITSLILLSAVPIPLLIANMDPLSTLYLLLVFPITVLLPSIPLMVTLVQPLSSFRLSLNASVYICMGVIILGTLLSLGGLAFSGPGFDIMSMHAFMLMMGTILSIFVFRLEKGKVPSWRFLFCWLVPGALALWSLSSVPYVVVQANQIVAGRPYCLGAHTGHYPVQSLAELRGFYFYTTVTGYKSSSRWFFHGILLVETEQGLEAYNWSPRAFRFYRISNPDRMLESPFQACTPKQDFLPLI